MTAESLRMDKVMVSIQREQIVTLDKSLSLSKVKNKKYFTQIIYIHIQLSFMKIPVVGYK